MSVTQLQPGQISEQVFQRLLQERIVFLGKEVDDSVANLICSQLLLLAAEDPDREITLYINSPGGVVDAGMAIYDIMQYIPNPVATVANGLAASMGQFLLTAGSPGRRYALRHARIMMHQPSGGIGGTASDIRIQADQLLYMKRTIAECTAFHTGQDEATINRDFDRDRWFTADEAKDYGLVDQVIQNAHEVVPEVVPA